MRYRASCLAALCLALPSAALATVWNVSSISQLKAALASVNPGDRIEIQYGIYQVRRADDPKHWFRRPSGNVNGQSIRIVGLPGPGGEKPVFDAGVPEGGTPSDYAIERGLFYIWDDVCNYEFENLEIRNVRGQSYYSNNAAAAYINGDKITFRHCYSHDNDNGWFSTTSASDTLLEYCQTAYNGKIGSGDYTHNHYMASQTLTVRGCYIHDSTEGQNFKSRCTSVSFEYNWVRSAASYEWELASNNKGNALLIGNVITKRPGSGNRRIVQLSDGTATDATSGTLTMINNTIISTGSNDPYVTSISVATANVVLYNNVFAGPSTTAFSWSGTGTQTGSHNWYPTGTTVPAGITASLFGTDPGFLNQASQNYHLLPVSPLRNAGVNDPQWLNWSNAWEVRVPDREYLAATSTRGRLSDAALDIGAFEGPIYLGDISNDGSVDVSDVLCMAESWGLSPGNPSYDARCDLNGVNGIDVSDLLLLAQDWGK